MRKWISVALMAAGLSAALMMAGGCEDDSDLSGAVFRVQPDQVTLDEGDGTIVLEAVGGAEPFAWSVSDDSLGSVTGEGRTVTYTRLTATGANRVTVADNNHWTASSLIIQDNAGEALSLSPDDGTLNGNQDKLVFTATGGVKPYQWAVGIQGLGSIQVVGANQAIYTRLSDGNNTVIVTDSGGHAVVAAITQPPLAALAVSPASTTVAATNGTQVFTVAGGTGAYTWSFENASPNGTLSQGTGASTLYTSTGPDPDVLRVTDGESSALAVINKR